jgi:hypothetical protein
MKKTIILTFLLVSHTTLAAIPVLTADGLIGEISSEEYSKTIITVKEGIDQNLVLSLKEPQGIYWKLDKISVGVGATGEIGIGPYKLGSSIKQRFLYAR